MVASVYPQLRDVSIPAPAPHRPALHSLAVMLLDDHAPTNGPLRILLIVESSGAGTGRHVLDLADGMLKRGCEVHLIYSTARMDRMFEDRLAELKNVHQMPLSLRTSVHPSDLAAVLHVHRYIRQFGPFDVIHGHSSKGGAIARLAAFGNRVSAFYTLHGLIMMDPSLPRWKWLFYLTIELVLSRRTSKIIAVSPEEARAARRLGFGQDRVMVIPNGVGPPLLTPRQEARNTIEVDADSVVIGFVGRLVEQKAPEVLLGAFATAQKIVPQLRLAMVGAGPLRESLRKLSEALEVADKIRWLGERDAREVFAAFDIFAISSQKEGLPYVVLEAMAAGLPVVATSSAGVEILVETGNNGTVVPPDDVTLFGKALIDLASNPARLAQYGQASRERAKSFTIDLMVDRTLAAYVQNARPRLSEAV